MLELNDVARDKHTTHFITCEADATGVAGGFYHKDGTPSPRPTLSQFPDSPELPWA